VAELDEGSTDSDPWLNCKKCGDRWEFQPITGVPYGVWVAHLERQVCPSCGTPYQLTSAWNPDRWLPEWKPKHGGHE
jgi:hypothetical protein